MADTTGTFVGSGDSLQSIINKTPYANIANGSNQLGVGAGVAQGVLAALPTGFKTSVQQISDFRLGTFLGRQGVVNGSTATLINGVINFIKSSSLSASSDNQLNGINFKFTKDFIPIIIQTEFNINNGRPLYVIFDSTPDNISFTKGANWNPKDFYGRPEPVQIYASSGAVSFQLTGRFFASSADDMVENMALEKQLFSLVTPTREHFMPSPVTVKIGQWKKLRCIINNVTIDYQGPWFIPTDTNGDSGIMSHSPYVYDVTFNFTVSSQANTVQYAEDVAQYGYNGGIAGTDNHLAAGYNEQFDPIENTPDIYSAAQTTFSYDENTGKITYLLAGSVPQMNTAAYLKTIGLPGDANNAAKQSALGEITSGLSAVVQTSLNKNFGTRISKIFGK